MPHRKPSEIDRMRGRDIAALRKAARRTQGEVGEALGLTYQQIGKYERGESAMTLGVYEEIRSFLRARLPPGFAEAQAGYAWSGHADQTLLRSLKMIKADLDALRTKVDKAIRDAERT